MAATQILNVAIQFGVWQRDTPGDTRLHQRVEVLVAGRATRLVEHAARRLADVLPGAEYGRDVIPMGLPYGLEIGPLPVGAVAVSASPAGGAEDSYTFSPGPDTSRVILDVHVEPGTDSDFRETLYGRLVAVEQAFEGMRAARLEYP